MIEEIRRECIRLRESYDVDRERALRERISSLDRSSLVELTRAFTIYFHLINLAEEHHRVRVLREREAERNPAPRPESIEAALQELAARNVSSEDVSAFLRRPTSSRTSARSRSEENSSSMSARMRSVEDTRFNTDVGLLSEFADS